MAHVDIAIIGAGIAGLSCAVACHRNNINATVFEAAPDFKPIGTSISLWPNAIHCLANWGIDAAIANSGEIIEQIAWRRPDGTPYFVQPLQELYCQIGYRGYCVRRSDLHEALSSAIPQQSIRLGARLVDADTDSDQVVLRFSDGQTITANHVVAADGIWSLLRRKLFREDKRPRFSGYGAWLGLATGTTVSFAQGEGCEFLGANGRLGIFETGNDTRYWFFVSNSQEPAKRASPASIQDLRPLLEDWPTEFADLILESTITAPIYASFYDRPVSKVWGYRNVTLIGDAMHPFVPNLGQGACQAIEDGYTIVEGLRRGLSGSALHHWMAKQRHGRVKYMQRTANLVGRMAQNSSRISRAVTSMLGYAPFRQMTRSDLAKQFTLQEFSKA